jgi:hypothetical protein
MLSLGRTDVCLPAGLVGILKADVKGLALKIRERTNPGGMAANSNGARQSYNFNPALKTAHALGHGVNAVVLILSVPRYRTFAYPAPSAFVLLPQSGKATPCSDTLGGSRKTALMFDMWTWLNFAIPEK